MIPRTSVLDHYCMTYNIERDETELGKCSCRNYNGRDTIYNELPKTTANLTEHTCGKDNHASTLCGKCKSGYSPLVYSYDMYCMNCTGMTYNWIKYIAVAYVPLTFFFLIICDNFQIQWIQSIDNESIHSYMSRTSISNSY